MKDIKEQLSELREEFNRRIDEIEKELKPEFKVGQWVFISFLITRILRIDKGNYYLAFCENKEGPIPYREEELRPATPQEIEGYLRSICDKYVGKKVRDLINGIETKVGAFYGYDFDSDYIQYYYDGRTDLVVRPYHKGKFADILPSLKPKPETREEFKKFLKEVDKRDLFLPFTLETIDDFLNLYDIK